MTPEFYLGLSRYEKGAWKDAIRLFAKQVRMSPRIHKHKLQLVSFCRHTNSQSGSR